MFRNLPRITRIREIFNDTTNARMEELEQRLKEIQIKLELNCLEERQKLTKDSIIEYLTNPLHQTSKRLLRTLIEKILVYDDKIEIFYKYTKKLPKILGSLSPIQVRIVRFWWTCAEYFAPIVPSFLFLRCALRSCQSYASG